MSIDEFTILSDLKKVQDEFNIPSSLEVIFRYLRINDRLFQESPSKFYSDEKLMHGQTLIMVRNYYKTYGTKDPIVH